MTQKNKNTIDRDFILFTGPEGNIMIDTAMQKFAAKDHVKLLVERGIIESSEEDKLVLMIDSEDLDDLYMAKTIIEEKSKHLKPNIS